MAASQVDQDDVEYLYTEPTQPVSCQLCNLSLDHLTFQERGDHYAAHFAEQEQRAMAARNSSMGYMTGGAASSSRSLGGEWSRQPKHVQPKDSFWYPLMDGPPPKNYSPGLIPVLKRALTRLAKDGSVRKAVLCDESVTHICGQMFDRVWSCGYRNFLMACTALATQQRQPAYFSLLDSDPICGPGVRNLQSWVESAWREGYDTEGAGQLKHRLVGTSKWIGTGELYVAYTYKGIPSQLVDFPQPKNGTGRDTAAALSRWVVNYFTGPESSNPASPRTPGSNPSAFDLLKDPPAVTVTSHMPLILQHSGHSRTIVGYEITRNGATNLLIFDPAKTVKTDLRHAGLASHARTSARRSTSTPKTPPPPAQPSSPVANASSSSKPSPHLSGGKPTSALSRFFHSTKPHLPLKRLLPGKSSEDPIAVDEDEEQPKRFKGGGGGEDQSEPIIVDDNEPVRTPQRSRNLLKKAEAWPEEEDLIPQKVVEYFRVSIKQLSRNEQYQIMWFPMTDPLTDREKEERKVVTAERILI